MATHGIHHITAIVGPPQGNVDFYAGLLGQRLVKKTVNFDDPQTYHLYYGDERGNPGTIMTFFPWEARRFRGRRGAGQATASAYCAPPGSLGWWAERLRARGVDFKGPFARLGEQVLSFHDPDMLLIEVVEAEDERPGWEGGPLPAERALRGFHSLSLTLHRAEPTAQLLCETLGFRPAGEEEGRLRFVAGAGGPGTLVDLVLRPEAQAGQMGVGAVHHVAFRVADDEAQQTLREVLLSQGCDVSPVMDRQYFHSIYFNEPGGVLFEVATDPPGFATDEPVEKLGESLKLPPWLESSRERIETGLRPLQMPGRTA